MIDRSHPTSAEYGHHLAHTNHDRYTSADGHTDAGTDNVTGEDDAEDAAWLQSIQSAGLAASTEVKGLQSGALVMDISQLRQDTPVSKKSRSSREKA